jgi:hypothetical protein
MSAATGSGTETIYVRLLEEDVEVWRPVEAAPLGRGRYRLPPNPDPGTETWEFEDRDVAAEPRRLSGGEVMVAVARARSAAAAGR